MLQFVMSREELEDCIWVIVHILISDENLILAEKGDTVKESEKEQMIHILITLAITSTLLSSRHLSILTNMILVCARSKFLIRKKLQIKMKNSAIALAFEKRTMNS